MEVGIRTYLHAVNDQGGIARRKIELLPLDDGYEPVRALANMKELYEQRKVFAVIGNVGTPTAVKALPYALEKNLIFFGPFTGAKLLRKVPPDRYVFNYRASYEEETAAIVKYLVENRKIEPTAIAVFAQQEEPGKWDGYGESGLKGAEKGLKSYKVNPETIVKVGYTRNTTEVEAAVQEIVKHQEVKAIVMVPTYEPAALFIKQVKDARPDMIFTNVSFVGSNALAADLMKFDRHAGKYAATVR